MAEDTRYQQLTLDLLPTHMLRRIHILAGEYRAITYVTKIETETELAIYILEQNTKSALSQQDTKGARGQDGPC